MKKLTLSLTFVSLIGMLFLFSSCKKESSKTTGSNQDLITKVNTWLDKQKVSSQPNKAANIELLKNNLYFANLSVETSDGNEQIVIVPINEKFKEMKGIDPNAIPDLVLILDKYGAIRRANVVLSSSYDGQPITQIPKNTFYNIYNTAHVEWDSKFQFLSVTGKRLYELQYKDKNLFSAGIIQPKPGAGGSTHKAAKADEMTCTDWYLVTTYYDAAGDVIDQTTDYVGQSCQDCDNGMYESLCGDGSGPGSGGIDYEYEVATTWTWVVYNYYKGGSIALATVNSNESVKGKKVSSETGGGHFTSIKHSVSYIFGGIITIYSWSEASCDASVSTTGQSVSSHIIGTFGQYTGGPLPVDNTGTASFASMGW